VVMLCYVMLCYVMLISLAYSALQKLSYTSSLHVVLHVKQELNNAYLYRASNEVKCFSSIQRPNHRRRHHHPHLEPRHHIRLLSFSGVQTAEGLGCPGPTRLLDAHKSKIFFVSIHLPKFLTTFFSRFSKFYLNFYL